MYLLSVDIGGTKIEGALLQFEDHLPNKQAFSLANSSLMGIIVDKGRAPTERLLGYDQVIVKIEKILVGLIKKHNLDISEIKGVGINLPGTVHPTQQKMLMGNSSIFIGKDIIGDVSKKLNIKGIPVICENDANCFALAESVCGAGLAFNSLSQTPFKEQTSIGLILGTGVGGGVVISGNILRGSFGGGGELGHSELFTEGHPCYCGKKGCAEQYLSGPAVEAAFNTRIYAQIENRPTSKDIFELAKNSDPVAIAILKQYKQHLIKFLGNLSNIFDPHYFVFGGGVSCADLIYEGIEEELAKITFVPESSPKIYKHKLGDSAGVIGAALLALEKIK